MSTCWNKLVSLPNPETFCVVGKPMPLNQCEYIIPIGKDYHDLNSLIKYNMITNEYKTFMPFKAHLSCRPDSAAIDTKNAMLYIPGNSGIFQIDLTTKESKLISKKIFKYQSSTIIINNNLHIFHYPTPDEIDHAAWDTALFNFDFCICISIDF